MQKVQQQKSRNQKDSKYYINTVKFNLTEEKFFRQHDSLNNVNLLNQKIVNSAKRSQDRINSKLNNNISN